MSHYSGKTNYTPVQDNACVMSVDEFLRAIIDDQLLIDSKNLMDFMLAATLKLREKII